MLQMLQNYIFLHGGPRANTFSRCDFKEDFKADSTCSINNAL